MDEKSYWLGFSVFPGVGPKRFKDLVEMFGSAESAWEGTESELRPVLGKAFTEKFLLFRKSFSLEVYRERLEKKQVGFVILTDSAYPVLLKKIPLAPFILYYRGDKSVFSSMSTPIGVVGTRKITSYGKQVTEMITEELVHAGCVIVSGLAMGVDAVAHKTTLDLGGKTIAVLGSGVDVCHPTVNEPIYNRIITGGGAVASEYPLGEVPSKGSFPSRNRIIAGLTQGIVVTEGAHDSGALITAADAFSFGRHVYGVPGPITSSLSKGPNSLLAQGAKLVTSGADILKDLGKEQGTKRKERRNIKGDTKDEQRIIDLLEKEAMSFDEIVKHMKSSAITIGTVLSLMELKGIIIQTEGGYTLRP